MLRYLPVASALVVAAMLVLLALGRPDGRHPAHDESRTTHAAHGLVGNPAGQAAGEVVGDAPWALSALPECFHQQRRVVGSPAYVTAHLPPGAGRVGWRRVRAASLEVADCRLTIGSTSADVVRGGLRLHIPGAAFFVAGDSLIVERAPSAHDDVRYYALPDRAPAFVAR